MRFFRYVVLMMLICACISGCNTGGTEPSSVSGILYERDEKTPAAGKVLVFLDGVYIFDPGCLPSEIENQANLIAEVVTDDEGRFSFITGAGMNHIYFDCPYYLMQAWPSNTYVELHVFNAKKHAHTDLVLVMPKPYPTPPHTQLPD